MGDRLVWERDGRDWPGREGSAFVEAGGLRWHVQRAGSGPVALLLHGTGAATHSWRGLGPILARHFTVVAPDLPGHGFTAMPRDGAGLSLPGMADALAGLLRALGLNPAFAVGHSAGAAILARMSLDGTLPELRGIASLNGAILPLRGFPGQVFSPMARAVSSTGWVSRFFAWRVATDADVVGRMLRGTGSTLDPRGVELYRRLASSPGHVAGAFGMMANWDLHPLARELRRLRPPLLLVVGANDRTIAPAEADRTRVLLPAAAIVRVAGAGHLAHEERPEEVAGHLLDFARGVGALP